MIIAFLTVAVLIFSIFRALYFMLRWMKPSFRLRYRFNDIVPLFEFATWLVYVLWIVKFIYDTKNYFVITSISIISLLFVVPLFFFMRDFVSGLFLKMQNKIPEGNFVDIGTIKGIIRKAGHFRLDIEDSHGNISSISYFKVRSKTITRYSISKNLEKATLEFNCNETKKVNEFIDQLKSAIMSTPWVAVSQPLIVENTEHKDGRLIIQIGAYMLDKSYAENIKSSVLAHLS